MCAGLGKLSCSKHPCQQIFVYCYFRLGQDWKRSIDQQHGIQYQCGQQTFGNKLTEYLILYIMDVQSVLYPLSREHKPPSSVAGCAGPPLGSGRASPSPSCSQIFKVGNVILCLKQPRADCNTHQQPEAGLGRDTFAED